MDDQDHVGYWIDRAYWGRGIASRVLHLLLQEVAKRPLVATAATSNRASLRVLQKCGFVVERVRLSPPATATPSARKPYSCCGKPRGHHGGTPAVCGNDPTA
jgi:GNAT superfamily N-acetyltransferase